MATRQNKKRKGKVTRERTVTTLTGAETHPIPHSHSHPHPPPQHHHHQSGSFLIPTSDDLAASANIMSSPFSVASSSGGHNGSNNVPPPPGFAMPPANFSAFGYNPYMPPMAPPPPAMSHPPQPYYPDPNPPPGLSDLEVLESLKQAIKNNQHEIYRAIPQPEALRSLYKGVIPDLSPTSVPPHPEQVPRDTYHAGTYSRANYDVASTQQGSDRSAKASLSGSGSVGDFGRARKDSISWDPSSAQNYSRNGASTSSSNGQVAPSHYDVSNGTSGSPGKLRGEYPAASAKQSLSGSAVSESLYNGGRAGASQPAIVKTEEPPSSVHIGAGESSYPPRSSGNAPPGKSETKDDLRTHDAGWSRESAAKEGRRRSDSDRAPYPPGRHNGDARALPSDRPGPLRDQRYPDRDRDTGRDRDKTGGRDWERDRDRDRRWGDWRPREDRRGSEYRRPEERHYDSRPDRRWEPRPDPVYGDKRPERPAVPLANGEDKMAPPSGATDRPHEDRAGGGLSRSAPVDHTIRPPPVVEERPPVPTAVPEDLTAPPGLSLADASRPVSSITEQRPAPRPTVSLEERISRPPSLQERIGTTAPASYVSERPPRPAPSLEERLSHASDERPPAPRPVDDRPRPESNVVSTIPAVERDERARQPSGDRFGAPPGDRTVPPPGRAPGYVRAPSVARDSPRTAPRPVSPPLLPSTRPPPPPGGLREPSRERGPDYRPYYRTEFDRPLEEDRRSDGLDIDNPDRYRSRRYPDEHDRARVWPPGSPRNDPYAGDAERRRDHRDCIAQELSTEVLKLKSVSPTQHPSKSASVARMNCTIGLRRDRNLGSSPATPRDTNEHGSSFVAPNPQRPPARRTWVPPCPEHLSNANFVPFNAPRWPADVMPGAVTSSTVVSPTAQMNSPSGVCSGCPCSGVSSRGPAPAPRLRKKAAAGLLEPLQLASGPDPSRPPVIPRTPHPYGELLSSAASTSTAATLHPLPHPSQVTWRGIRLTDEAKAAAEGALGSLYMLSQPPCVRIGWLCCACDVCTRGVYVYSDKMSARMAETRG
ncbi:hypothetical protein EVG20_g9622 [Dentipellis fragilis]|uniref:Uncharacterized protein n=1 Tax=Dentipellis fragilis TaxID=205917 RepID=A0A4Y9XX31_9AGAM|nr:hypothetical protein EVG20_g9622 [Dentipellis fragilis]